MWQSDSLGWRARIGLLTPHWEVVPESEFQAMAPQGVSIHSARVPFGAVGPRSEGAPRVGPQDLRAFAEPPAVDDAAGLLADAPLDAIVYAFTSSSYLLGAEGDRALKERLEGRTRGIPVVISSLAAILALRALAVNRVALVHPPWFSSDRAGAEYFQSQGFDVVYHGPAQVRTGYGEVYPAQLYEWTRRHVPDSAEAVFFGGTGMRAIGAIQALEEDLGRPVISATQVGFWQALRLAGTRVPVVGYGQLFAKELPAGDTP